MTNQQHFEPNFLVIGTIDHPGDITNYDWVDPTLKNLNFEQFHSILLNFQAFPINIFDDHDVQKLYRVNENGKFEEIGDIPISALVNLGKLDLHLTDSRSDDKLTVVLVVGNSNSFSNALFTHQLLINKDIADMHRLKYSTVAPHTYPDGSQFVYLDYEVFSSKLKIIEESNISMINAGDLVKPYFDYFEEYDFIFKSTVRHTPYAHDFYNQTLAFMFSHGSADVLVLPHPKLVNPYDVNERVIREMFLVQDIDNLLYPDWLTSYNTARQIAISEDISHLTQQINSLNKQRLQKEVEFSLLQMQQRVLFTRGTVLLQAIEELFETLNIPYTSAETQLDPNFTIELDTNILLFEIFENTSNVLERRFLRNLNQFVEDKEEKINFSKPVKGILVVVNQQETDPKDRDPLEMDEITMQYIQKHNFCIMTVDQIYHIYHKAIDDPQIDIDDIFNHIITTAGVFESIPNNV